MSWRVNMRLSNAMILVGLQMSLASPQLAMAQAAPETGGASERPTLAQCTDQWRRIKSQNSGQALSAYRDFMSTCFNLPSAQAERQPNRAAPARARLDTASVDCANLQTGGIFVDAQVRLGDEVRLVSSDKVQAVINYLRAYGRARCEQELKAGRIPEILDKLSLRVIVIDNGKPRMDFGELTAAVDGNGPWQIQNGIGQTILDAAEQTRRRREASENARSQKE
jgi:hypothetical protein